jgi:hypothetical protein
MSQQQPKKPKKAKQSSNNMVYGSGAYVRPTPQQLSRVLQGSGPYYEDMGRFFKENRKAFAPMIGAAAGGILGNVPGAVAGIAAGQAFNKAAGWGDYALMSGQVTADTVPVMHSSGDSVRVVHREFIGDITSSVAFVNSQFSINPGLSGTFPWLSTIANSFEQYEFHGLMFVFRSTSADALNSTNTALGTVIMAADYNAASQAYQSKIQMEQSMWCVSAKPSESQMAPIECDPKLNAARTFYVRQSGLPSGTDVRLYDLANFQLATVGSQAAAVVGELWVTYDVSLLKPQLNYGAPSQCFTSHWSLVPTAGNMLDGATADYNNMGVTVSADTITFPAYISGRFSISAAYQGASTACVSPTTTGANLTLDTEILGNGQAAASSGGTVTNFLLICYVTVPVSNVVSTVTFSTATVPASLTVAKLLITQLNDNT